MLVGCPVKTRKCIGHVGKVSEMVRTISENVGTVSEKVGNVSENVSNVSEKVSTYRFLFYLHTCISLLNITLL